MADIAERKVGTVTQVEAGQEWRSKRNGRVVKVTMLHFSPETGAMDSVTIRDGNKRRTITATPTNIPGYEPLVQEYADFGDVARDRCHMQSQYCSGYIDGRHGSPNLGDGLRFRATGGLGPLDTADYHDIEIHKDDVEEFVTRVLTYRRERGVIA